MAVGRASEQLCVLHRGNFRGWRFEGFQLGQLSSVEVAVMLSILLSAIIGFVAFLLVSLYIMGSFWPSMPYETALPALLALGCIGSAVAILLLRRLRAVASRRNAR